MWSSSDHGLRDHLAITWQSLLEALSRIAPHSTVDSLDVSSITWRPFKPANAPSLLLTNENEFNLFVCSHSVMS